MFAALSRVSNAIIFLNSANAINFPAQRHSAPAKNVRTKSWYKAFTGVQKRVAEFAAVLI